MGKKPQPVRRVEIPKPDGGKRKLGIPTILDRLAQQAIIKAKGFDEEGHTKIVDPDLAQNFDTINHGILINMLREEIKDERVISLIREYLKSGEMEGVVTRPRVAGTPRGGNLPPLLSNIYLRKFDKLPENRGHKFVRYADGCNIYVKSQRVAERVMESSIKYLEGKVKLTVKRKKSKMGSPLREKFLGLAQHKVVGKLGIRPHGKVLKRFKEKVKKITARNRGKPIDAIIPELKKYTTGWLNCYAIGDMRTKMQEMNQWIRSRLGMYRWKKRKKISAEFGNLKRSGLDKGKAWEYANTRLGYRV